MSPREESETGCGSTLGQSVREGLSQVVTLPRDLNVARV